MLIEGKEKQSKGRTAFGAPLCVRGSPDTQQLSHTIHTLTDSHVLTPKNTQKISYSFTHNCIFCFSVRPFILHNTSIMETGKVFLQTFHIYHLPNMSPQESCSCTSIFSPVNRIINQQLVHWVIIKNILVNKNKALRTAPRILSNQ